MKLLPWLLPFLLLRCFMVLEPEPEPEPQADGSGSLAPVEQSATALPAPSPDLSVGVEVEEPETPESKELKVEVILPAPLRPGQQKVLAETLWKAGSGETPDEPWRYLLYLPKDYFAEPNKEYPLLYYLHGRSRRGRDLDLLKRYGPPSFLDKRTDFPFIVVSPQLPDDSWPTNGVLSLLNEVTERYRVDEDRICLTGVSLGGGASWYVAAADPDRFAALVPICGYAGTSLAPKLTELPIWAFHGAKDEIVSIEPHQALIDAIEELGGTPKFTIYPEGTHGDIIVPTYRDEALWEWLLEQRR